MRGPTLTLAMAALTSWLTGGPLAAAPVSLESPSLRLALDPAAGGRPTTLTHRGSGFDFLPGQTAAGRHLWELTFRTAEGHLLRLRAGEAGSCQARRQRETLTLTWTGVGTAQCPANLTVTATVQMMPAPRRSAWRLAVQGTAPGVLWKVDYPRLAGLRPVGEDRLALPIYAGRLVLDPARRPQQWVMNYPAPAAMQFLALWGTPDQREPALDLPAAGRAETGWAPDRSNATGLYFATEDGQGYLKSLAASSTTVPGAMTLWAEHFPGLKQWPQSAPPAGGYPVQYQVPYPVVVAAFTGDYLEAARLYLDFARKQAWCSRGPADDWPTALPPAGSKELTQWVPAWFREAGFWAKFYHEPAKVLPEWAAYAKWLQVPLSSHYYRYNIAIFDDNYNDMLPGDPYLLSGVRDARDLGVSPMPYVNGVIWDTGTQSWIRQGGLQAALKNEAGEFYPWLIGDRVFAYMCPFTNQWRANLREVARELVGEHGMTGLYLDCLTASAAHRCYDPTHGHPVHGGNSYMQGQRRLMAELRADSRAYDPQAAYFPEAIGEWVMDLMDGYLTLDLQRFPTPGAQLLPLFAAAYHPYTIHFGSDATLSHPPDLFAWEMGQLLTWGSQPLHSTLAPPAPRAGDPNSEVLRETVQAYYQVGQRFLQGGTLERLALRPPGSRPGRCGLELVSPPHQVSYQFSPTDQRQWHGPAVLGSAWSRQGDTAVVLMNLTAREQTCTLTLRPDKLGLAPGTQLLRAWPLPAQLMSQVGGDHALTLGPGKVLILVLTTDVARASRVRPLRETPWELVTTTAGPLPPVTGPAGSLWACREGPVRNDHTPTATVATALWLDEAGRVLPRQGRQAAVAGARAEGQALPRNTAEKPFVLLRRLPHTAAGNAGEALVLSGDERHLCAVLPGGTTLTFGRRGLVLATAATTGRVVQAPAWLSELKLPPGPDHFIVGYANPDLAGLERSLAASTRARVKVPLLLRALTPLRRQESVSGPDLARVAEALLAVAQNLGDLPAALIPGRPLEDLHRQLAALLTARAGVALSLTEDHDWLSADIPHGIRARVTDLGDGLAALSRVELWPLGDWPAGKMTITPAALKPVGDSLCAGHGQVTLRDGGYVERVVPVLGWCRVRRGEVAYPLLALTYLEANRPLELQASTESVIAPAGRTVRTPLVLRNWSPHDLRLTLAATAPQGWQVGLPEGPVSVPAGQNITVEAALTVPAETPGGDHPVVCRASHGSSPDTTVQVRLAVAVQPRLVPLMAQVKDWARPTREQLPALRQAATLLLHAAAGERLQVTLHNVRVTRYTDSLAYRLSGPDRQVLKAGSVAVDQSLSLDLPAPETGVYTLWLRPQSGSVQVAVDNRVAAEVATAATPVQVFCSPMTRYFHVAAGARRFRLGARDGGPDEGGRFVLTSPTGRVALDRDGNFNGGEIAVEVRPGEAGNAWTLRLEPRQDMTFWLAGDVSPYLSTAPERALVEAGKLAR